MFEKLDVSPKNCNDCHKWAVVKGNIGICGADNDKILVKGDNVGCEDQLSVKAIRTSYRIPELIPRIKQVINEIETREIQQLLTKIKI